MVGWKKGNKLSKHLRNAPALLRAGKYKRRDTDGSRLRQPAAAAAASALAATAESKDACDDRGGERRRQQINRLCQSHLPQGVKFYLIYSLRARVDSKRNDHMVDVEAVGDNNRVVFDTPAVSSYTSTSTYLFRVLKSYSSPSPLPFTLDATCCLRSLPSPSPRSSHASLLSAVAAAAPPQPPQPPQPPRALQHSLEGGARISPPARYGMFDRETDCVN
ncbi:uncharacterized protein [Penaeus vannamei]|uniref:uncharacterized protein n=1 Tax=Penaeus vannamei TaxID=6689 RepID=UPI00387F650D